jgi:hypothetical protein
MEVTVASLLTSDGRVAGALAYARADGRLILYRARAILLATGGAGKIYRITSNSWESTGDGTGLAYEAGAQLQDMEFVQFHPTGMVWPPGVRGILVTEGVRGEGGLLRNKEGDRFMEKYDPERMELSARDVVARAINSEVLAGRGDPDPTPIPVGDWAFSAAAAALHPFDQLAAGQALDKAGWTIESGAKIRTKNKVPFKVELVAPDSFPNRQVADALARQLLEIGLQVDVKAVRASQLVQNYLLGRKYQMALASFDVGPDPDQYSLWHSGADASTLNFAYSRGWGLIDSDLESGRAAVDPQARLAAYIDFQMLMADAAPAIFLYSARYDYAMSPRVHGVHLNKVIQPAERFQYVTQWYVNTSG